MELKAFWFQLHPMKKKEDYTFFTMRRMLLIILLFLCTSAVKAQQVSLQLTKASLEEAFREISKQSGYEFIYTREQMLRAKPITIQATGKSLAEVLHLCFTGQPLTYVIEDRHIVVKDKTDPVPTDRVSLTDISGRVTDENGLPLPSVTVTIKGRGRATATNSLGRFVFTDAQYSDRLVFTCGGFEPKEVAVTGNTEINITMKAATTNLDETIIVAYGTTTRRRNTGSVSRVDAKEIATQPVANPLAALQGRVPGMIVTQSSGVPGASFKVQIRGQNSIASGNNPLFIIDGVPFAPGNNSLSQLTSAAGTPTNSEPTLGISPFSLLNPADIESIEVLKDADATAIYGSRGANGVILITTKRGKPGKLRLNLHLNTGWSKVGHMIGMMHTQQYLAMRREAFLNDGITPATSNAYDLLVWDTTRYTNFPELFTGGVARTNDAQLTVSNGTYNTHFLIGTGYHRETTVYPGNMSDRKISFHSSLQHKAYDQKVNLLLTASYSSDRNTILANDLAGSINLAPNYPALYDSSGKLRWMEKGLPFANPLALLERKYAIETDYLMTNFNASYRAAKQLQLKLSLGYNNVVADETSLRPKSSIGPFSTEASSATYGNSSFKSWIVEPQAEYTGKIRTLNISMLAGATLQDLKQDNNSVRASGFPNDALLGAVNAATELRYNANNAHYRYAAIFGRIHVSWKDQLMVNLSGRRDGSSRFGADRQWANFGAIGAAWIFSSAKWFSEKLPVLSFAKLRGSIGLTGNDQIGDYQYTDNWSVGNTPYNGVTGLNPIRLYNPGYAWETNRKIEAGIEMGWFSNRLFFTASYFNNRSGNQLIHYNLPIQAGFATVLRNMDAVVENSGWEVYAKGGIFNQQKLKWNLSANISFPKNRLISFPGLMTSSYATQYREGYPLSLIRVYRFTGVDPVTGVYQFEDLDKNGVYNQDDRIIIGDLDPDYYGGIGSTLEYRQWTLDIFFDFRKQLGRNYFGLLPSNHAPGVQGINQPLLVIDRWHAAGQITGIQKYTTGPGSPAYVANATRMGVSSGAYGNASFTKFRNLSVSYTLPSKTMERLHLQSAAFFIRAQNLYTWTRYKGTDPERQSLYVLPPLRTIATGFNITF